MITDSIPVFNEYKFPDELNESLNQLHKIYTAITEFNAVLSLNQALLLQEYERSLIIGLSIRLEKMYNESVPYSKPISFYTDWVISESDIKQYDIDESQVYGFTKYQNELKVIQKIKKATRYNTGGYGCE